MSNDNNATPAGVLGDGALHAGKYNMALVRRAIREDWPISDGVRALLTVQMASIVRKSRTDRNKVAAAKVLIAADAVNAKREAMDLADEHKRLPNIGVNLNVNHNADAGPVVRELLNDDQYLEWQRQQAIAADTGTLRAPGQPGAVEDGQLPCPDRPEAG